ncbi:hypothetical protein HDEF_0544 [Candidatus Hamiltonella defensa 5AT (Acyrthosiphon pisum)]|uniref:Uncharacterized protein n=1 Tax=Hamiltonella defensa subsp. Acyrthosiphon pisum (strain 5AT) TaxID=572265 RepID=C4K404_HAMD5|nr:hypothetical protein HDEF_0544 [Candidatus Hamiltonella defensa 5AT (Acyrthosiphon pisum)]
MVNPGVKSRRKDRKDNHYFNNRAEPPSFYQH